MPPSVPRPDLSQRSGDFAIEPGVVVALRGHLVLDEGVLFDGISEQIPTRAGLDRTRLRIATLERVGGDLQIGDAVLLGELADLFKTRLTPTFTAKFVLLLGPRLL